MLKRKQSTLSKVNKQSLAKHAKWTTEETGLLKQQIEAGESVASVAKLFPNFTVSQVHSKLSNLKKQGIIKNIPSSGVAPSLAEGMTYS